MKKLYPFILLFILFLFFHQANAQLVSFSFAGSDGDESTWPSSAEGAGILPSAISRGPGITATANADRFNSKNWTVATSPDVNDYIEFTITPKPGYSISLSSTQLQHQRSSTGPKSFVIRTSVDGFTTDATNIVNVPDVNSNQLSTFSFTTTIGTTSPLVVRIYAYNAEAASGTWGPGESVDGNDIVLSGLHAILPVKFVNVSASRKGKEVEVKWTNATESDVVHYVLERSGDGRSFSEITRIYPTGNHGRRADYRSLDLQPFDNTNYYRIKAQEKDGQVMYTNIVKTDNSFSVPSMGLYPNPVQAGSQIILQLNGVTTGSYEIKIYNAAAQLLHHKTVPVNGTVSTQTISLKYFPGGIYVAEVTGVKKMRQQFIVQ
ncbi:MAG TPA: T9SS type A sorting domain-containing protein [Flavisolibacter sp.]|nr:T9SS type A sorting domain-containing protein [Flavisolibacter sp.]